MAFVVLPPGTSYRICQSIAVAEPDALLAFIGSSNGDACELYIFDGNDYSDVIATANISGGAVTFLNVTIPSLSTGTDRFFVIHHVPVGGESFSDAFELLAASNVATCLMVSFVRKWPGASRRRR